MRGRRWMHHDTTGEFELDLAPLLAVIMKLVPVMLLSSAFVQLMVIETELPQVVKEAIQNNNDPNKNLAKVRLEIDNAAGFKIYVTEKGQEKESAVALKNGALDFPALHENLVALKKSHPDVFQIDLVPRAGVEYGDIVRTMDEARRPRDQQITFPVFDAQQNKQVQTPFMFPEVVFANSLESGL
ncbi:MAG: biopolymer transporter ExbD [Bdellovibrionaceae bacterium]|nr:biopolymer transporter ExbD [Pseudobdellovibrionaceae bacterium]